MHLAHVLRQYRIVVPEFSYHVERLNVFSIVVHDALKTRNLPDGANGCASKLPCSLSNSIRHGENLVALIIEHQMIVPEMRAGHMPMDVFALYLKTKNFHWHMSGSHFRDYHLMLDDQGDQIFSMTDAIAERARKLGGTTVRSIGQISRFQRIVDNDAEHVKPLDMIAELRDDNAILTQNMREVHSLCDKAGDVTTASLLENWIDESEKRNWFLFECGRPA